MKSENNEQLETAIRNLPDEVSNIKESLTEFYEEWLCSESASDAHVRGEMISHFNALDTLLSAIETSVEAEVS